MINENDDAIAKMIADMRIAAKEDRDLNIEGKPGINKMKMFPVGKNSSIRIQLNNIFQMQRVMNNLNKGELRLAFVEANLLSVRSSNNFLYTYYFFNNIIKQLSLDVLFLLKNPSFNIIIKKFPLYHYFV